MNTEKKIRTSRHFGTRIFSILLAISVLCAFPPVDILKVYADEVLSDNDPAIDGSTNGENTLYAGGKGTEEEPYLIATAEQLNNVRYNLDACFEQTADIDLSLFSEWMPIGTVYSSEEYTEFFNIDNGENLPFTGCYNGGGYKIDNMSIHNPLYENVGLFGYCGGKAYISNIVLNNIDISIDKGEIFDAFYNQFSYRGSDVNVGGIIGKISSTVDNEFFEITNCIVKSGKIEVVNCHDLNIGGISGFNVHGKIKKLTNFANIKVVSNKGVRYEQDSKVSAGGIIGGGSDWGTTVTDCVNYGNIDITAGDYALVGGISGSIGEITYCVNYGNIFGEILSHTSSCTAYDNCCVGGICGYNSAYGNSHLINYGSISAKDNSSSFSCAGGIIGFAGYKGESSGDFTNAYNLCGDINALPYNGYNIGRIAGSGSLKPLCENYSIDTTLCNGATPTENIGANLANGESLTREEIESKVLDLVNFISLGISELNFQIESDYGSPENVLFFDNVLYDKSMEFSISTIDCDEDKINSGHILLCDYDNDKIIHKIPKYDEFYEDNGGTLLYSYYWTFAGGSIYIFYNDLGSLFDATEFNGRYYFDLQTIKVNGKNLISQNGSKSRFNFKKGSCVLTSRDTFHFANVDEHFWDDSEEAKYHITDSFINNEIMSLDKYKRNKIISELKKQKWVGSCYGMSVTMMLQNAGKIAGALSNNHKYNYEHIGDYPKPVLTAGVPYGSRDIINYFHMVQLFVDERKQKNDLETMDYIINEAAKIASNDDIIRLSYCYKDGKNTFGHSVNVIGKNPQNNELYVYDNANYNISVYTIKIRGNEIYCTINGGTEHRIFNLGYNYISDYESFITNSLKSKTKIQVSPKSTIKIVDSSNQEIVLKSDGSYSGSLIPNDISFMENGDVPSDLLISLPFDTNYRIISEDNPIDYSIVNDAMFYYVKSENAVESSVDALQGVSLLGNKGEFEITVSSDNEIYDMFDVSGNGQGNVTCTYTDKGVSVDSGISDSTVTIYDGIDSRKYNIPENVNKFIVTEADDKPAILIDTDNDGSFETNIIKQTIIIPENVTVTTSLEVIINNGDEIHNGDVIRITANIPDGKKLVSLTVNGVEIENDSTYTVGDSNVVIEVQFDDVQTKKIIVSIPENITVIRDDIALNDGDEIHSGDILQIEANVPEGKTLSSLIVNGSEIENGSTYTVGNEDVVIEVAFEDISTPPAEKTTISIPENVTVIRDGIVLNDGDEIHSGDILRIEVNVPEGKTLSSLTVNGSEIENDSTYTVSDSNVVIEVQFEDVQTEKIIVSIPENVTVIRDGIALNDGDEIHSGDILHIEANVPNGKTLSSLTVNGSEIKNGSTYTVSGDNVVFQVQFKDIETQPTPDIKYTITIPENVEVNRLGSALKNGDEIHEGDNLTIMATAPSGYRLSSLTVNGESFSNGGIFTVGKEDVVISASFRKISFGGSSSSGRPSRPGSSSGSSTPDDDHNKDDTPNDHTNTDNPSDPNTPDNPDDKNNTSEQPFLNSNNSISGWDNILVYINDTLTKVIAVDMNGTTILPGKVLQAIKGKDVKLILKMDEKISWSIEGSNVEKADQDIDLQVTMNTDKIPNDAISELVKDREYFTLSLNHNGDFGFDAYLVITVGTQYDNEPINLFWYNNNKFKSEDTSKVQYGMAVLKFTHASDWLVVFGDDKSDVGTSSSGSSTTSDTSQPIDVKPNETKPNESNNSNPTTTEPGNSSDDEKKNPNTGNSRVSLATFLALITSAAVALISQKRKK